MKIKAVLLGLFLAVASSAVAQYDMLGAIKEHGAEVEASIKKMEAPGKHNQGAESFKDFIAKFSSDPEFMQSRIKLSAADREKYASLLEPSTFTAKMPVMAENDGEDDIYYQLWGETQYHTVHLECLWDGILDYSIVFNRQPDGTWALAQIVQ